jgi:hypothetical protein
VSVDEHWRMRADPELTAHWTAAELGSVLVHHVWAAGRAVLPGAHHGPFGTHRGSRGGGGELA